MSSTTAGDVQLEARLEHPLVFLTEDAFEHLGDCLSLLDVAISKKRPLVIVCPKVSDEVLQTIALNHKHGKVCVGLLCYGPSEGEFGDLAASCGCSVVNVSSIQRVQDPATLMGAAELFLQTMDSTVVRGTANINGRVRLLQERCDRTMEERDREIIRERISKLTQKFAVIRVGGRSAVEMSESKDRVIDALNASRNALAEGVVPGGGAALLHASKYIDAILKSDEEMDQDRRAGMMIVRNAARLPMKIIGDNAGVEGPVIVENVAEEVDFWMGYDAQKDKYIDMYEAGIIDPLRVVMQCIVDASSVAGLMITTEASVCDHTEKELLPKD
jgi:chaperonin GroEL (HSP60 family)